MESMSDPDPSEAGVRCVLGHEMFSSVGSVVFRRATTDGLPVMVMSLGDCQAAVPLRALQHQLAIADESDDGRMLELIARSLEYVNGLHLGDRLPNEVIDGTASWEPDASHRAIALNRLRAALLAWLEAADPAVSLRQNAGAMIDGDVQLRQRVQAAFDRAALALGLPGRSAVVRMVEEMADELAYIEALRARLLQRAQAMAAKIARVAVGFRGDGWRHEAMMQVRRLSDAGLAQMMARFDEIDAQTSEVMDVLRNMESQRSYIRATRDWLYRTKQHWEPILQGWDAALPELDEAMWLLIGRTYNFLAPRFMPVQEWDVPTSLRQTRRGPTATSNMVW